jgi:hypothetical protein
MANIAGQAQGADLTRLGAQGAVGAQQQAMDQQRMDMNYTNFTDQRDFARNNAAYMNSMVHGAPYSPSSTVSNAVQAPNMVGQILGAGAALAGFGGTTPGKYAGGLITRQLSSAGIAGI